MITVFGNRKEKIMKKSIKAAVKTIAALSEFLPETEEEQSHTPLFVGYKGEGENRDRVVIRKDKLHLTNRQMVRCQNEIIKALTDAGLKDVRINFIK